MSEALAAVSSRSQVHREHILTDTLGQARQVSPFSRFCLTSKNSEGTLGYIWGLRPCPVCSLLVKAGPVIGHEICHPVVRFINTSDPTSSATFYH